MPAKTSSDLAGFLSVHSSTAALLSFSGSVHSVEGAARELGTDPTAAIKTLIFVSSERKAVAAIIPGQRRGDRQKIEAAAGCKLRFASPQEALELTGYAVGGTPPVDNQASLVIIDPLVMARDFDSYGGGGDDRHLLRISSKEILRLNAGAKIAEVSAER